MSSERDLDKVLAGKREPEGDSAPLADMARQLEGMFDVETPSANRERAVFASAVGVRGRRSAARYIAPAIAGISLLAAVYFAGRAADPGNALYPVRKALQEVDLAPRPTEGLDERLAAANTTLQKAEAFLIERPGRSQKLAADAIKALGGVELLLADVPESDRERYRARVEELHNNALVILVEASVREVTEDTGASSSRSPGSENSGPGSESSGSGSGDSGDSGDSSGSGSGDSDEEDNSGSGSDSSGSGSGSDDNSGSGSG